MTNLTRTLVLLISLVLGMVASTALAQDITRISRLEQTIAQLQAELASLKANTGISNTDKSTAPDLRTVPPTQSVRSGFSESRNPDIAPNDEPGMVIDEPSEEVNLRSEIANQSPSLEPDVIQDYASPRTSPSTVVQPPAISESGFASQVVPWTRTCEWDRLDRNTCPTSFGSNNSVAGFHDLNTGPLTGCRYAISRFR